MNTQNMEVSTSCFNCDSMSVELCAIEDGLAAMTLMYEEMVGLNAKLEGLNAKLVAAVVVQFAAILVMFIFMAMPAHAAVYVNQHTYIAEMGSPIPIATINKNGVVIWHASPEVIEAWLAHPRYHYDKLELRALWVYEKQRRANACSTTVELTK